MERRRNFVVRIKDIPTPPPGRKKTSRFATTPIDAVRPKPIEPPDKRSA